jgi:hypothetical protein
MADFARWIAAAVPAFGWDSNTVLEAYQANRSVAVERAVEHDIIAAAVRDLVYDRQRWSGTATELLAALNGRTNPTVTGVREWPRTPRALVNALKRATPDLRRLGIEVDRTRGTERTIDLTMAVPF